MKLKRVLTSILAFMSSLLFMGCGGDPYDPNKKPENLPSYSVLF